MTMFETGSTGVAPEFYESAAGNPQIMGAGVILIIIFWVVVIFNAKG